MKVSISQRFQRSIVALLCLTVLAGCLAPEVKVNPTRTGLMATFAVAPKGADGMTTTKTEECTFRAQISVEKAKEFEANPGLIVEENACVEFDDLKKRKLAPLAVQGSPQLAGELTKSAVTAATGGTVNFIVQRALQRKQGEICRDGGCINTINNNLNVNNNRNNANAQGGVAVSNSEAGASAVSEVRIETPCTDGGCK